MKALTVWQPWASLIIIGAKPFEFRGWRFPRSLLGQRIVIHAASRPMRLDEVSDIVRRLERGCKTSAELCLHARPAYELLKPVADMTRRAAAVALPLSAGMGTAVLGNPVSGFDVAAGFGVERANDSDRDEHANWGWPLADIDAWEQPLTARGAQGFWSWPSPQDVAL